MKYSTDQIITNTQAQWRTGRLTVITSSILIFSLAQGCASEPTPATFSTPDDAVQSLVTSLRANDQDQLRKILGKDGEKIISSGDEVADRHGAETFLAAYDEKHQLILNENGSMTLDVGSQDWPDPIPIIKDEKTNTWSFDTQAGMDEVLNRRIGRNELAVIEVCQAIADAQREYALRDPDGDGKPQYAQKFLSDPGKKDGLYWQTGDGEDPSPLGPLVADAVEQGYSSSPNTTGHARPFHGYLYRMLKSQGANAPGGALDYVVDGEMIGGFAVVAYPAEYGNSGIMTFMVDYQGVVYQKDLGNATEQIATEMNAFDPDPSWQKAAPSDDKQP